ncbi:hypothetical protein [Mucilaginibacter sp. BT774]|uniref:hypothetical protein n=1 Tax=Mucilaginibacter sp. BT774 TaxID=3062276 RepID=UPI002675B400|nr:hypothetical protein [Mucilaginibacter sp. BT774]MDO3624630.1 hypothetical protein [Mucilaginibacter sp. BT774]
MENKKQGIIIRSQVCPVHRAHPSLSIDSDRFTIRCCCNLLTRQYVSKLETKLKGLVFETILNNWEDDLLINELLGDENTDNRQYINTMLTIRREQEQ